MLIVTSSQSWEPTVIKSLLLIPACATQSVINCFQYACTHASWLTGHSPIFVLLVVLNSILLTRSELPLRIGSPRISLILSHYPISGLMDYLGFSKEGHRCSRHISGQHTIRLLNLAKYIWLSSLPLKHLRAHWPWCPRMLLLLDGELIVIVLICLYLLCWSVGKLLS